MIETTCRDHNDTLVLLGDDKVSKSELNEMKLEMEQRKSRFHSDLQKEVRNVEKAFQLKINSAIESKLEPQMDVNKSLHEQQADLDTQQLRLNDLTLELKRVMRGVA